MLDGCPESRCNLNEEEFPSNRWSILRKITCDRTLPLDDVKEKEKDGWKCAREKNEYLILTIGGFKNTKPLGSDPIVCYCCCRWPSKFEVNIVVGYCDTYTILKRPQ